MSMIPLFDQESKYDAEERKFLGDVLARRFFGAIYAALTVRARDYGLTRKIFGDRIGSEKTGVSKLLRGHGNWTYQKLSDVTNALDLDVEICLIDRHNPYRVFTSKGEQYITPTAANYDTNVIALSVVKNQIETHGPSSSHLTLLEPANNIISIKNAPRTANEFTQGNMS